MAAQADAVGFRHRAAAARSRPHRAIARNRLPAFPGAGQGRHQAGHQRAVHLLARRQSAGRAGAGPAEFLVRLRRHGGLQPGRRRRPGAVAMDGRMAIRASMSGPWMWRASANGRRAATPTTRCARITARRFSIRFPNEELPAARPQQTTALYDTMIAQGRGDGRFSWGLETPLWFAPKGVEPKDIVSFHRSNDFPHVKAEVPRRARTASASPRSPISPSIAFTGHGAEALPVAADDQQDAEARAAWS